MTSIYPQLPGPPTMPGWYWRVADGGVPVPYLVSESTVQWYATYGGPSEFTWYGPIPEPLPGEREPCQAWGYDPSKPVGEYGDSWELRGANGDLLADVGRRRTGECWWSLHDWEDGVVAADPRSAMLAAEDAVLAEAWKRIETIGGNHHARH